MMDMTGPDALPRVTLVVATRNRAHTLRIVAPSFYAQDVVDEIVFVDDAGEDETAGLLADFAARWPGTRTVVLRNDPRRGLPASRNRGAEAATNEFLLFCDDDEHLEQGYARTCLGKLLETGAGAVGGRRVYMQAGETVDQALGRAGHGFRDVPPVRRLLCELNPGARYRGDVEVPFSFPNMVTRRALLQPEGFDASFGTGTCYREETDYYMRIALAGHRVLLTSDVRSIHLSAAQTSRGGVRAPRAQRVYWSVHHTARLYRKHWSGYARLVGLRVPRQAALACFAVFSVWREYLRPPLYRTAMRVLRWRSAARRASEGRRAEG
jgi:glycosyltransferase involved in cell wall biosynthesis